MISAYTVLTQRKCTFGTGIKNQTVREKFTVQFSLPPVLFNFITNVCKNSVENQNIRFDVIKGMSPVQPLHEIGIYHFNESH